MLSIRLSHRSKACRRVNWVSSIARGPPPHFGDKIGVPRKAQKRVGKNLSLPGLDHKPTPMPPNKSADFTVRRGDGDNPASGGQLEGLIVPSKLSG
jgi:hypothetical protein